LTNLFDDIVSPVVNLPVSSSIFLDVFLPVLLFHAALTIDVREIARDAAPILALAILAVFAAAAAIGFSLWFASVPLTVALLVGTIVATTDPAAVVAIFREVGAPPRLVRLLEGESLLNDAAAIVLFGMLVDTLTEGAKFDLGAGLAHFAQAFLGGLVLGAVAGRVFGAALPLLGGSRVAEVTLSVALPYIVYLSADEMLGVSGVVAAASAGLTGGALARVRMTPGNWRYMERVWDQTGFLASSLIFVIACTLVPRLLDTVRVQDALLLLIVVAAALLSRAAVLFGILPLLSTLHLGQKVSAAYKLAITWGGLRGAVTLALALSVTENAHIDVATQHFVAVLATGFVLFTLLVNGLTLRRVIRLLMLDRLSPIDLAVRSKVLALSLADVRDVITKTAHEYDITPAATRIIGQRYKQRIDELSGQPALDIAISDPDQIKVGLLALANRERRIILDHHEQNTVSAIAIERLLRNTNSILDAARLEGLSGYELAATRLLGFARKFRIGHFLHRTLHIDLLLQREVSIRFETLLVRRLALEVLTQFTQQRLRALLGLPISQRLGEVITRRAEATARALDCLRLQYPDHAEALERRFLQQSGQQLLTSLYRDLFEEGLIGGELLHDLEREHGSSTALPPLDLGLQTEQLIGAIEMFAGIDPAELKELTRLFRPRLLVPDELLIRKGERGRGMFFISSGAVEVLLPEGRVRLGSGEFVGEMALLSHRPRQADVVSLGYGRALELRAADFRHFLSKYPHVRAQIEGTAEARTRSGEQLNVS
jgi:CPA1 family monovalent cation:H+ antiporter